MVAEFMISLVDYDQTARRAQQLAEIVVGDHATCRIIWRTDDRDVRLAIRNRFPQRLNVIFQVEIQRHADYFAVEHCRDLSIQREGWFGNQDALSLADRNHQERLNQLVRSVSG